MSDWVKYWAVNLEYPTKNTDIPCESEAEARQALQSITEGLASGKQFVPVRGGRSVVVLSDLLTANVAQNHKRG